MMNEMETDECRVPWGEGVNTPHGWWVSVSVELEAGGVQQCDTLLVHARSFLLLPTSDGILL